MGRDVTGEMPRTMVTNELTIDDGGLVRYMYLPIITYLHIYAMLLVTNFSYIMDFCLLSWRSTWAHS
jgi:hypothetical protein